MNAFSRWPVLLLLSLLSTSPFTFANDDNNTTVFETTADTFVDSTAALDVAGMVLPVKLSFWTTPHRDWDSTLLLRLKPLVVRFDGSNLVKFHPHQGIVDGSAMEPPCRQQSTDIATLSDECLTECVNAGRYCAVEYNDMEEEDETHAGLTGADLVMESSRRLCVWIVYTSGHQRGDNGIFKYFDYVQQLRDTKCDMSLTDNCIDRVYREVGIDDKDMTNCFHNAGGVGAQVDSNNALLKEEMHRSSNMDTDPEESFPQLVINNNEPLVNVTTMSDWQILASVCNAFSNPKPKVCDFCLLECPNGNDDHDPTQQCLWDLTCGDDRTFDDWMDGTGAFDNTNNNSTNVDGDDNEDDEGDTSSTPTVAPTAEKKDEEEKDELPEDTMEDLPLVNVTDNNTTDTPELPPVGHVNDTNTTLPPPAHHDNEEDGTKAPSMAPHHAPPQPQNSKPTYNSPIPVPKPTHSGTTHHSSPAPHQHSSSGGSLSHTAAQKKAPNTTNTGSALQGVLIAILCLGGVLAGIVAFTRYRNGKDIYATVHRDANGLASRVEGGDLTLNVEMSTTPSSGRSDGYAPPAKGTWG